MRLNVSVRCCSLRLCVVFAHWKKKKETVVKQMSEEKFKILKKKKLCTQFKHIMCSNFKWTLLITSKDYGGFIMIEVLIQMQFMLTDLSKLHR